MWDSKVLSRTLDVLHVDFSEKLKFAQSCSKCVFKYPEYIDDHKNSYHDVLRVNKSIFVKNSNWSIDLKNISWDHLSQLKCLQTSMKTKRN